MNIKKIALISVFIAGSSISVAESYFNNNFNIRDNDVNYVSDTIFHKSFPEDVSADSTEVDVYLSTDCTNEMTHSPINVGGGTITFSQSTTELKFSGDSLYSLAQSQLGGESPTNIHSAKFIMKNGSSLVTTQSRLETACFAITCSINSCVMNNLGQTDSLDLAPPQYLLR